ncbi:hypothetical protein ZWY2020_039194 [Hordeum vulgare]|nr:hypothetical protein ZWY2020_039194 [Hordeum vulgare]
MLPENSSTSPSLLLDQEGRDRHRAVRVLNAEVPSVLPSIAAEPFHERGGAKRSSLNQRFHEIKIDSFLDIWIDGWIYLSIQISFAISPKSLIWPGNKALLWAQEAKGMSSAASPPHFFISPCPFRMRFAVLDWNRSWDGSWDDGDLNQKL